MVITFTQSMANSAETSLPQTMQQWIEWIETQPADGWRIVTLEYPRWTRKNLWAEPIRQTMRELEQTFLTGELRRKNESSGATKLRRVVALGGDREQGVAFHAHCLIDGIGDDAKFEKRLQKVWANNVRKHTNGPFYEKEALTYSRQAVGGVAEYMKYIVRHEGNDLKFGVDKIDVPNTYLTPSTPRRI